MELPPLPLFFLALLEGSLYASFAFGLTLIFGVLKIINIAHGELMCIGGYIAYWMFVLYGLDPLLSIPLAFLVVFVLGFVVQNFLIKYVMQEELRTLLLTYGISLAFMNIMLIAWKPDYRMITVKYAIIPVKIFGIEVTLTRLLLLFVALIQAVLLHIILKYTYFGKAMRGCAQDADAAALLGINYERISTLTFALGSACAAVTGVMFALTHYLCPTVGEALILKGFCVVVLGGVGSIIGSLIGGLAIGICESLAVWYIGAAYKEAIALLILILALIARAVAERWKVK